MKTKKSGGAKRIQVFRLNDSICLANGCMLSQEAIRHAFENLQSVPVVDARGPSRKFVGHLTNIRVDEHGVTGDLVIDTPEQGSPHVADTPHIVE